MFFKLHDEKKIWFKKLSEADLGLGTSHQTHIGLYGDIFTFLHDTQVESPAFLIYNNNIDIVDCYFDRIKNLDGTYRSPKIRKWDRDVVSVVTVIRDEAAKIWTSVNWYLIWFGLENEGMVFYFFNDQSSDFSEVSSIIDLKTSDRLDENDPNFTKFLNYLENKVNKSGEKIIQELEIDSQVGSSKKYKPFDLNNANNLFKETGRKWEAIIDEYLAYQKSRNIILNYEWLNRTMETGLPYDFHIQTHDQNIIYLDVKSTKYKFEQPLIFSSQEIEFINETPNYHIYRVFDLYEEDTRPKLKICNNARTIAHNIKPHIDSLKSSLGMISVKHLVSKIAINPQNELINFDNEIILS